jgi:hypothetical protein
MTFCHLTDFVTFIISNILINGFVNNAGPDICGPGTKKVHVIFNYKDKNHLIKKEIRCKDDVFTHLYTLIVNPDGTYEVLIDNESAQKGDLTEDWDFLPAKMIKDPEAKKPEEWDDRAKIDDPEDVKPEDWEQPEHIADPDATKPGDWDDEMDGEWEPPMIDNPDYKGERSVTLLFFLKSRNLFSSIHATSQPFAQTQNHATFCATSQPIEPSRNLLRSHATIFLAVSQPFAQGRYHAT